MDSKRTLARGPVQKNPNVAACESLYFSLSDDIYVLSIDGKLLKL